MLPISLTAFKPWMAWAAAVGAALVLSGVQTVRLADVKTAHADTRAAWAKDKEKRANDARDAVQAARAEEQRRTQAVQGIANDTQTKLDAAVADADSARAAGQRLRKQIARLTRAAGGGGPAQAGSAQPSPAADAAADLLADVQRRLDEAADGIARFADQAHARGLAAERSYDALK